MNREDLTETGLTIGASLVLGAVAAFGAALACAFYRYTMSWVNIASIGMAVSAITLSLVTLARR